MGRHYEREELIRLRDSPLVCRPPRLPPTEEWMGPLPDPAQSQNQNRGSKTISRGKTEDSFQSENYAARRPTFDTRSKSSNVSENVILGPPKTSFASAGRRSGAEKEGIHKGASGNEEEQTLKDRSGLKERTPRDWPRTERNGEQPRSQPGMPRNRGENIDSDSWTSLRQNKPAGNYEQEQTSRKHTERENDRSRRDFKSTADFARDTSRNLNGNGVERSSWQKGSRNEPSWFRNEEYKEDAVDAETGKSRDWRDRQKGSRPWDRNMRQEQEPEWMEEPEPEEKKQTHTQDDFEQWKARMKAGSGSKPQNEDLTSQPQSGIEAIVESGPIATKFIKPLLLNPGFDDFLSLGDRPKDGKDIPVQPEESIQKTNASAPRISKASKFTSLFNPAPIKDDVEVQTRDPVPPSTVKDSSAEDKEGFARILSLLGQQQQNQSENEIKTPPRATSRHNPTGSMHSPPATENNQNADFFGQKSPPPAPLNPSRDSEFLLNLMQRANTRSDSIPISASNRRAVDHQARPAASNIMISPQEPKPNPMNPPPMPQYSDLARDEAHARDRLNASMNLDRRPPPGFPDMFWNNQNQRSPQPMVFPPGMPRPPGFDQFTPGLPPPPQRGPPPGFQGPSRGNIHPPGLFPNPQPDRANQFPLRPGVSGMPPQGFMTANGPPPGLPNVMFPPEGMPLGGFGDVGHGGSSFGHQQQQQRR